MDARRSARSTAHCEYRIVTPENFIAETPEVFGANDRSAPVMENDPAFEPLADVLYKLHTAAKTDRSLTSWQETKMFLLQPFMLIDRNISLIKQLLLKVNADEQLLQMVSRLRTRVASQRPGHISQRPAPGGIGADIPGA